MKIKTIHRGRSHLRKLLAEGKVASWFTIIDYRMRIGSARLKMGGIAAVATKKKYRGKGYMRALMEESLKYMKSKGYDLSLVLGIPNFYRRFGYLSCIPFYMLTIPYNFAGDARKDRRYRIRKLRKEDDAGLLRIYNRNNHRRSCSLVREKGYFANFPKKFQEIFVVEDKRGNLAAYFILKKSPKEVLVLEVGLAREDSAETLIAEFARRAKSRRTSRLDLLLPPDHLLVEFAKRYDARFTTEFHQNRGALLRIIDQGRLFKKLEDELNRRLASSGLDNYSGSLTIKTDLGATVIRIRKGVLRVYPAGKTKYSLRLDQGELAQLLAGYRSAEGVGVPPKIKKLIAALFPAGVPYLWDKSRFENPRLLPEDSKRRRERAPVYENQFPVVI